MYAAPLSGGRQIGLSRDFMDNRYIVVEGPIGVGKSSLAGAIARHLDAAFLEGDDYHPPENHAAMAAGRPLDDAMRRRFNLIPFVNKPMVKDSKLKEKLEAEYPAILRWMIDGCLDWQKNGLLRPTSVLGATNTRGIKH